MDPSATSGGGGKIELSGRIKPYKGRIGSIGMGLKEEVVILKRDCPSAYPLGICDDRPTLQGVTAPLPVVTNTLSGVISADSVLGVFRLVGRRRSRSSISAEVGETQQREMVSKRTKMSETWGRALGFRSQHFSINDQTSSDRPRMSWFVGRKGRFPARTNPGTA